MGFVQRSQGITRFNGEKLTAKPMLSWGQEHVALQVNMELHKCQTFQCFARKTDKTIYPSENHSCKGFLREPPLNSGWTTAIPQTSDIYPSPRNKSNRSEKCDEVSCLQSTIFKVRWGQSRSDYKTCGTSQWIQVHACVSLKVPTHYDFTVFLLQLGVEIAISGIGLRSTPNGSVCQDLRIEDRTQHKHSTEMDSWVTMCLVQ